MQDHHAPGDQASQVIDAARAAGHAIEHLCRTTLTRPDMTPAEVDTVLAHLADAAAGVPQAARQLSDILEHIEGDHVLGMDTITEDEDPCLAIETARRHLDGLREPALSLYRLLDAARNQMVHVATVDRDAGLADQDVRDCSSVVRRPEERQPPPTGPGGRWAAPPR